MFIWNGANNNFVLFFLYKCHSILLFFRRPAPIGPLFIVLIPSYFRELFSEPKGGSGLGVVTTGVERDLFI